MTDENLQYTFMCKELNASHITVSKAVTLCQCNIFREFKAKSKKNLILMCQCKGHQGKNIM